MIKVKVSSRIDMRPFLNQFPNGKTVWGDCEFCINDDTDVCDYWVIYENLAGKETAYCPPDNVIFISGEPPSVKTYNKAFLKQFGTVITCHTDLQHPNIIHEQQALPWHLGWNYCDKSFVQDYDSLSSEMTVKKEKLLSVICSNKVFTEGHKLRYDFVMQLKEHFGDQIDLFGQGVASFDTKWDAIAPYKYHVVIENSCLPHYWTEKLSDCYLAEAYPFYCGAPNLEAYFPENAYTTIDITRFDEAIQAIETAIQRDYYEERLLAVKEAKALVLTRYNLFPMLTKYCVSAAKSSERKKIRLDRQHKTLSQRIDRLFSKC